jgi:glycosyltransferase involved in cell wall biosynthesis
MKTKPFLSIITINYNNKDGLKKTIESVVGQNWGDYEHIIIDGGSTDGSVDVIKEALGNEEYASHVSYWCSEKDGGIWNALNKGAEHANGEYCLMLNGGDWLCDNNSLSKIGKINPVEDIIYFDAFLVKKDSIIKYSYPDQINYSFFFEGMTLSHQNTLIKTSLQKQIPYTNNYCLAGDIEFFMNALIKNNSTCRHVPDVLAYFDFENGISSDPKTKDARMEEWERLRTQFFPLRLQSDLIRLRELNSINKHLKGIPYKFYRFIRKLRGKK